MSGDETLVMVTVPQGIGFDIGCVPEDVWKGMLERQLLGELSAISPVAMSGPICTDGSEEEARVLREAGFIDAINERPMADGGRDYGIGYKAGERYNVDGPLRNPTNRELIGILL